jgi:hypothetical protein
MASLAAWIFALTIAVCATIVAAGANQPTLHMATTGIVSVAIAVMAIRDHQKLMNDGAPTSAIASSTARYLGLIWAWGALALAATYLLILETRWPEWWQFFIGFTFAAVASIAFSNMLDRDTEVGHAGEPVVRVGRALVWVQLVGMVAGIISLLVDHKFPRDMGHADWAGCNILFFGALAIGAVSLDALRSPAHV